jgi:hypothetical protein
LTMVPSSLRVRAPGRPFISRGFLPLSLIGFFPPP